MSYLKAKVSSSQKSSLGSLSRYRCSFFVTTQCICTTIYIIPHLVVLTLLSLFLICSLYFLKRDNLQFIIFVSTTQITLPITEPTLVKYTWNEGRMKMPCYNFVATKRFKILSVLAHCLFRHSFPFQQFLWLCRTWAPVYMWAPTSAWVQQVL